MSEQIERRRCIHYNEDGEPWREAGCQYADCAHIHPDRSAEEAALWSSARTPKPALPSYIYNVVHPEKENARREMKRQKLLAWRKERRAARVAAKARMRAEKENGDCLEDVVKDGSSTLHEAATSLTPRLDGTSADVATAAVPDDWETDHEAPDAEDARQLSKQAPIKRGGSHRKPAKLTGKELKRKRNKWAARLRLISLCATSTTTLNTLASEIKKNEALLDSLHAPNTLHSDSYYGSTSPSFCFNFHNLPDDIARETRLRLEREQNLLLARLEEEKSRNDVMRAKLIGMTVLGAVAVGGTKDEDEEVDEEEDVDVDEVGGDRATAQEVTETKTDTKQKAKEHPPPPKQKITALPSTSTVSTAKQPKSSDAVAALQEDQPHRSKRKNRRKKSKNKGKNRKSRNAPGDDEDAEDAEDDAEDGEIVDAMLPEAPEEGEIEVEEGEMVAEVKVEPKVEEEGKVDYEDNSLEVKPEPESHPIDIDLEAIDAQARLPAERIQTQTERQTTQRVIKDVRAWLPRLSDKVAMLQDALGEVYRHEVDRYYRTMEDLAAGAECTMKRKRVDADEEGEGEEHDEGENQHDPDINVSSAADSQHNTLSLEETAEAIRADRQQFNYCLSNLSRIWTTTRKIPIETANRTVDALRVAIDGIRAERDQRAQELLGRVQEMVQTSSAEIAADMKPQLEWALLQGVALAPRVSGRRDTLAQLKTREESLQEVVVEERARRDEMRTRVDQMKAQLKCFSDLRAQNKASIESLRSTIDECVKKADSAPVEDVPPPPPPPPARLPTARLVEALLASVTELARPQVRNTQSEAQEMLNQNSSRLILTLDARMEQTCKIAEDLTRRYPLQAPPPVTRVPKPAPAPAPAHSAPQILAPATAPPVSSNMTKLANRSPLNPPIQNLPPPPLSQPTALEPSVPNLPRSSPIDFQAPEGYVPPPPVHRAAYATTGVARSSSGRAAVDTYVQHLIPPSSSQQGPAPQSVFPLPHLNNPPPAINSHSRSAPPAPAPLAHQHTTMSASRPHQLQHPNKDISLPNMGAPHHPAGPAPVQPVVPSNASDCSFLTYPGVQGIPVLLRLKNSNPGTSRSFIFIKVVHIPPSSGAAHSQGSAPMVEIRDVSPGPQNGTSYQITIDSLTYVPPTGVHQTVICTIPGMNHAQLYAILQLGGNSECIVCKRDQPYGNRMHCETHLLAQVATMPPPAPPAAAPGNPYPYPPPNQPAQLAREMPMRPYHAPPANRPAPVKIHPTHSPTWLKDFVFSGKRVQLIELGGDGSILEFVGIDAFQSAVYVDARHTSKNPVVRMIPLESVRHIIPSVPSQWVVPICGEMKGVIHVVGTYGNDKCMIYSPWRKPTTPACPYRTTDLAVVCPPPGNRGAAGGP